MRIAFLGNFSVPYSTESHTKWTFEKLGHTVIPVQENRTTASQFLEACRGADLAYTVHTHGWGPPEAEMQAAMEKIKAMGVPTASFHLDFYWSLDTWDHRASRVGKTWDWRVSKFFSTDGGHEEFFKERGVNHQWLLPGCVEYGCHEGTFRPDLACDVAFVGSVNYHPEYKFRPEMVTALQQHYGTRFKVFQGYREDRLNDLYASVKVVVGDHVFAGTPRYCSDRLFETCGRGGFLIYPKTEGIEVPTAYYRPQDIDDLIKNVDYYLAHEAEREAIRKEAHEYVKSCGTYTHRFKTVLEVMGQ